ncbi:flippase-like domain-containing protein [candidate division TA06 bacterium]|uniref:Flippase-like domain-containing protein n=1 Tax=candidate division TA06 bacterium TaxID=2250710 RepID=A0A933I9R8_UNCT6|nr:flippase-like domain-containing protein [candidate division TA06 bacterium]
MKQALKKTLYLVLRIVISLGLIGWILLKVDRRELAESLKNIEYWYLTAALAAYLMVNALCTWRWQILLAARGIRSGYWRLFRYFLNGLFFGNFLPTTVGGDLARAYLVVDDCSKKSEALASVLVDRFIGLFGVIITGIIGLVLMAKTGQEQALLRYMAIGVGVILALVVLFLNKALMRKLRVLLKLPLLAGAEHQIVDFYHSLYVYRTHKNEVLLAFLQSLSVQLFVVVTAYFIARSIGIDIAVIPFFLYMPVIAAISMVPLSINGWGLQEWAFIVFFGRAGVPKAEALSLGFVYHLVAVAISVWGGVLWLMYGHRRKKGRHL